MKRFFLLTALMAVLGLSSCEKEPSVAIIGTWEAVKMEATASGMTMTIDMVEAGKMEQAGRLNHRQQTEQEVHISNPKAEVKGFHSNMSYTVTS